VGWWSKRSKIEAGPSPQNLVNYRVMNVLATSVQVVNRLRGRILVIDSEDTVPTLYWSPEFSVIIDGKGDQRHIWSLRSRNEVVAICQVTNVRFVDCSKNKFVPC